MKKRIVTLCVIAVTLLCTIALVACSNDPAPYGDLDQDSYNLRVRFDTGNAVVSGQQEISVVTVYDASKAVTVNGKTGIKICAPDDPSLGDDALTISRNDETDNYFLAGWYTERTPRVDDQGQALDVFGELTSVSGREQGYVYGGKWDFSQDILEVDPGKTYTAEEEALVLYAAWIPYFNYEFYAVNADGKAELVGHSRSIDLTLPTWNEQNGRLTMNGIPEVKNMTFEAAYWDMEMTNAVVDTVDGDGTMVDYEKGICLSHTIKIYTTWLDGTWFKIYNAKQFRENMRPDGHYILYADLDFANEVWPVSLTNNAFTGSIQGNGHTISNVTVTQANTSQTVGGLFGKLDGGASVTNLTFENIEYRLEGGSRMTDSRFGTLCGELAADAILENVAVTSGRFLVGDNCYPSTTYQLGLLIGSGVNPGMDLSGMEAAPLNPETTLFTMTVDKETGSIELSFT